MIVLDATTKSLQILLGGAVTTNQLVFTASYADYIASPAAFTPGANDGATNNTTAVTLVAAPAASTQRQVKRINVYNADTAQATVTIRLNNGGTLRTMLTVTLQTGERIEYEDAEGFRVFTVTGAVKVTAVTSTVEPGYIDGLVMRWVSATALTVSMGTAYIPSVGSNINVAADIAKTGLALSATSWYHVYLYLNSGVPDIEIVTTAPSTPYNGTARTKTGDTTRRYIGSVKTDGSGNLYQFIQDGDTVAWLYDTVSAPARVLSGGVATVRTTVATAVVVPVTALRALLSIRNDSNNVFLFTRSPDQPTAGGLTGPYLYASVKFSSSAVALHPLNASQQFEYLMSGAPTPDGAYIDVLGYTYGR